MRHVLVVMVCPQKPGVFEALAYARSLGALGVPAETSVEVDYHSDQNVWRMECRYDIDEEINK